MLFLLLLCISTSSTLSYSQSVDISNYFKQVVGSWEGSLTYLDYSTNKPFTIPANIEIEQVAERTFTLLNSFPEETNVVWVDTFQFNTENLFLNTANIIETKIIGNTFNFITEEAGFDGNDNAPAIIRHFYTVCADSFSSRKEVKFIDSDKWVIRHTYNYSIRKKMLTIAGMKTDLAMMKTVWEQMHAGLYRYNTPEQINAFFADADKKTNNPLEQRVFYLLIAQLNNKINCGHTYLNYYNNNDVIKANLYSSNVVPFLFRPIADDFIITHDFSDAGLFNKGDIILSINNIPIKQIRDSLLTVTKADGLNGYNQRLYEMGIYPDDIETEHYCLFDIYFPMFFKADINEINYVIKVKTPAGVIKEIACNGIDKSQRLITFENKYGPLPQKDATWTLKKLNETIALFTIGDFATYNWDFDYKIYLDSIFTMLKQEHFTNLIIDIRNNEGGSDEARDEVLSYLIHNPVPALNEFRRLYRFISLPDSILPYLNTWDPAFLKTKFGYLQTTDGYYALGQENMQIDAIMGKQNSFVGDVYLITDAGNTSSTFLMAKLIKYEELGKLVGEPTGGSQQGINGGEIVFFTLPYSKIEMDIPLIYQQLYGSLPDKGIQPNVLINTTREDIINGADPQVEWILNFIKSK